MLLRARGYNLPSYFTCSDFMAMNLGLQSTRLVPAYLERYVMTFDGVDGPEDYGKLVSLDELPGNFNWLSAYNPGDGLLILEAQQRILSFLIDCCRQILRGLSVGEKIMCCSSNQPEPPNLSEWEPESLVLGQTAAAPYRLPPKADFDLIESMLSGALSAAIDHIWMLREDPYYFMQTLKEIQDHQPEAGQDVAGEDSEGDSSMKTRYPNPISARGCSIMASEMYYRLELFAELHKHSQILKRLYEKHAAQLRPSKKLPEEFKLAIARFLFHGHRTLSYLLWVFMDNATASPPSRRFFVREPSETSSEDDEFKVKRKPDVDMDEVQIRTFSLLHTIGRSLSSPISLRYFQPVEELAEFLENEPRACDSVTSRVANILGNVAVVSHCIVQIYYCLPWARDFDKIMNEMNVTLTNELHEKKKEWSTFKDVDEKSLMFVPEFAVLSLREYIIKPRHTHTKCHAEHMQLGEKDLDYFWSAFDKVVYTKCGNLEGTPYRDVLTHLRVMRRTADWDASVKHLTYLYKPLSTIYVNKLAEYGSHFTLEAHTNKPELASIGVDKRSLKVFGFLFTGPSTRSSGHATWKDFLHAMTSSGLFTAVMIYPLLWQFRRTDGRGCCIQLIEYVWGRYKAVPKVELRRYGRKLAREFGWEYATFVLDEGDRMVLE